MRIDFSPSSMPELERSRGSSGANAKPAAGGREATDADDVARLTTGSEAVQTLKGELQSIPEIRKQRVDALRQAIDDRSFRVAPGRIADAMLAELNGWHG